MKIKVTDIDATGIPDVSTFLRGDGSWAAAGGGGGGGGSAPWELIASVDLSISPSATVDFTNLGGYTDLLLLGVDTTASASSFRGLLASVDNGSSFYSAAGDYKRQTTTGVVSNVTQIDGTASANSGARSYYIMLSNTNVDGVPKLYRATSGLLGFFVGSLAPVNALRAITTLGNYNGGMLHLLGRPSSGGGGGSLWYFNPPTAASGSTASGASTAATYVDDADVGMMILQNALGGDTKDVWYRTLTNPTLDFDMQVRYNTAMPSDNFSYVGLCLWDSVGNRGTVFNTSNGAANRVDVFHANAPFLTGGFSSRPLNYAQPPQDIHWFRIEGIGADYRFSVSATGKDWRVLGSFSRTAWLTNAADRLGLFVAVNRFSGVLVSLVCDHFTLTGPAV